MGTDTVVHELKQELRNRLRSAPGHLSDAEIREMIEEEVFKAAAKTYMTASSQATAVAEIFSAFRGLDILQPLMDDPEITEVMVNGPDHLFIERRGKTEPVPQRFESRERLEDLIQTIVGQVNRTVNEASPIVDARLPDGSRVHVVLPPIALNGPILTIRKFPQSPMRLSDLTAKGTLSDQAAAFLRDAVEAKCNIFVSGGTGSGKTTFLNALCQYIPREERVITIEDSAELQLRAIPNLVSLETRNANAEGRGELSMRHLIRAALRMRPNRIIVGEVRGGEALDMLQAMNTGHDGSLSTGHGNSIADMLGRLETMVLTAMDLPIPVVRKQIASAIDIMVHLQRFRDGSRKVVEISELTEPAPGELGLRPLFRYRHAGRDGGGGMLEPTGEAPIRTWKWELFSPGTPSQACPPVKPVVQPSGGVGNG
ncbi:CpaF family protein [Paenibacillus thermoaerophilus]|uniref:CpaF family protein n=1 Tax=Paenibacillus thermoaerophilus TaxID=1215385 RepID=A0ABW2V7Q0_9BACL|nr:CpaF family protein [Paenibacillus thermoaerophilus]TMV17144.1 CpaF family protein [Paenibacillus thermoaerophilus]